MRSVRSVRSVMSVMSGECEREEWRCLLVSWRWSTSVWLARIGSSHVDASLGALRCLLSVVLSARLAIFANHQHCDGRYSLPHPLIRFYQTNPTYRLSEPSRLQRAAPSVSLNIQSQSLSLSISVTATQPAVVEKHHLPPHLSSLLAPSTSPPASPPPPLLIPQCPSSSPY